MTKQDLVQRMQENSAWVPGKRVKIDFGGSEGAIMLDGAAGKVSDDDGAADTTIKVGWDDWQQMSAGQLDGMTAPSLPPKSIFTRLPGTQAWPCCIRSTSSCLVIACFLLCQ